MEEMIAEAAEVLILRLNGSRQGPSQCTLASVSLMDHGTVKAVEEQSSKKQNIVESRDE